MATKKSSHPFLIFLSKNYLSFGLLISAVATAGSLILSEIMQLPPCDLCWYQRAAMYPLAILFGVALWKNDKKVYQYVLPISVIGFVIAIYHILLQLNPNVLPCSVNSAVSCATKQIEIWGFDAIPLMSALAFLVIIVLSLIHKKLNK